MPNPPQPEYLNVHDAAHYLRVHPQTLARLIRRHQIPVHLRQCTYLIKRTDIDHFPPGKPPDPL
jgi:excisionase family DNA binding protein